MSATSTVKKKIVQNVVLKLQRECSLRKCKAATGKLEDWEFILRICAVHLERAVLMLFWQ